jgi:hypothetical protein
MEPSLSYTAIANYRSRSGSQLTLVQALTMAQELLRHQPTDGGRDGCLAPIAKLVSIANENPAQGDRTGHAPYVAAPGSLVQCHPLQ